MGIEFVWQVQLGSLLAAGAIVFTLLVFLVPFRSSLNRIERRFDDIAEML